MATTTLHIKSLDSGFVLTQDGKEKAVEYSDSVKQILVTILANMTEKITHASVREMCVTINVEVNPPKPLNP